MQPQFEPLPTHIYFAPFTLDVTKEELRRGGARIALRPKTFALLHYLLQRPDRLIVKEELITALWPGTAVTDTVLAVCVAELRKALDDNAKIPRFIETVHRRGYRFVAQLSRESTVDSQEAETPPSSIVGRVSELCRLHEALERAVAGERQIVFVTGEAGIGKTTLIEAFLNDCVPSPGTFWIGRGQCVKLNGRNEPYGPVLEALNRLCHQPGAERLVDLLRTHAPSWLLQLAGVITPGDREALQREYAGLPRERMLRELVLGVEVLTAAIPLVLVLEDLHWADHSTVDLIASLAQRTEPARLLLVGTYRPVELIVTEHPLRTVAAQLEGRQRCVALPLELLHREHVAQYVEERFRDNRLPPTVAEVIHAQTCGNALFMVTVTDHLVAEGAIARTDGAWTLQRDIAEAAAKLPTSLRQLIVEDLERLSPAQLGALEAASVVGLEFLAQAVSAAIGNPVDEVEACCEALARRHQFIAATVPAAWPDGSVAACYRFTHPLYRTLLYDRLPPARRARLHRVIGECLEGTYGDRAAGIAGDLATHFEVGRDHRRWLVYSRTAALAEIGRAALPEGVRHLEAALRALEHLPQGSERWRQELELLSALGPALLNLKGFNAPEVEHCYERALQVAEQLGDQRATFAALLGIGRYHRGTTHMTRCIEIGERLLSLAVSSGDPAQAIAAHHFMGTAQFWLANLERARTELERVLDLSGGYPDAVTDHGHDATVTSLCHIGLLSWLRGYPDRATQYTDAALRRAAALNHAPSIVVGRAVACWTHAMRGDLGRVEALAGAAASYARERGFAMWEAIAEIMRGWAACEQGAPDGLERLSKGFAAHKQTGAAGSADFCALLAGACLRAGDAGSGLDAVDEGFATLARCQQRYIEPELHRLKGELLLQANSQHDTARLAEECFREAISVATAHGSKSLQLRAATSWARLAHRNGSRAETRRRLRGIYDEFTEGHTTRDLQAARALLA
jgi:DNA-binding winged helix-turn-helix (wHTH) protein